MNRRPGHNGAAAALRHAFAAHGVDVSLQRPMIAWKKLDEWIYEAAKTAPNRWETLRSWAATKVANFLEEFDA